MRKKALTLEERDKLRARFDELHKSGAERFGILWLQANLCATSAATATGVDASDVKMRTLLTETCFRILTLCEKEEAV